MNIKEAHEMFCQHQVYFKNYTKATITNHRDTLKIFLKILPEIEDLEQVTYLHAQRFFYTGRKDRNWKPTTFITHLVHMNVFYTWAVEKNMVEDNPFAHIEKPRLENALPKTLTKQEAFKIIEMAANMPASSKFISMRNHAIFATFVYTGLRRKELCSLNCTDVDLENSVIHVRQGKGNKDRVVPIPYRLKVILERYIAERRKHRRTCPEFFASSAVDRGFTVHGLRHLHRALVKAVGIRFSIHQLRHTFATLMVEGGCDLYALSKMMGHSDIKTTTVYLSASVEHLRGQIDKHPLNYI